MLHKLGLIYLPVVGFADVLLAKNRDLASDLGYIALRGEDTKAVLPLCFMFLKAKSVVRSAMATDLTAFADTTVLENYVLCSRFKFSYDLSVSF